jgi:hypothetical protein
MFVLTLLLRNGKVDMLIVLDETSIDRIRKYDPAEIQWQQLPKEYSMRQPATIGITFATAEEQKEIERMSQTDPEWKKKAFQMLTRGFQYQPELGDHGFGPISLDKPTKGTKQ